MRSELRDRAIALRDFAADLALDTLKRWAEIIFVIVMTIQVCSFMDCVFAKKQFAGAIVYLVSALLSGIGAVMLALRRH